MQSAETTQVRVGSAFLPRTDSCGLRPRCVKSIHCTNCFLRGGSDIIYQKMTSLKTVDFYKIHLPFCPLQSQEERQVTWRLCCQGSLGQLWGPPLSSPLLATEPPAHISRQPSVASQSHPLTIRQDLGPSRLLFRSVLGF